MNDLIVIGSMNVDQIVVTNRIPKIGETVIGSSFQIVPGGKGANQAVAASRLGGNVDFVGCVGTDLNGTFLIENFKKNNIDTSNIIKIPNATTGIASINVCNGENNIIVVPGANYMITKDIIDKYKDKILNSKTVLLQLEIPIEVVEYIIDLCFDNHVPVVLNPAPAYKLNDNIIKKVTYLTPNEHEATFIFDTNDYESLVMKYPNKLIITLGEDGAICSNGEKVLKFPAYDVPIVDTTGAGDTFNGAFSLSITKDNDLSSAITYANRAAALKIQKMGAQTGMPTFNEMEGFNEKVRNLK